MNNLDFINDTRKQFEYYKGLAEKAMAQMPDDKLNWQFNDDSNSVAIIVKHLWGNMLSRWTDFLTSDGEKEWRNRDAEFEIDHLNRVDLMKKWDEGWKTLFDALATLEQKPENLETTVYIRNMGQTAMDAVCRQLAHYSYHVGQIVHIAKMIQGPDWKSLTIPKGKSSDFNADKFSKPQRIEHFTEGLNKKD